MWGAWEAEGLPQMDTSAEPLGCSVDMGEGRGHSHRENGCDGGMRLLMSGNIGIILT